MTAAEAYKRGQMDMRRRIAQKWDHGTLIAWNPRYIEFYISIRPLPKPRKRKERKA